MVGAAQQAGLVLTCGDGATFNSGVQQAGLTFIAVRVWHGPSSGQAAKQAHLSFLLLW